MFLRPTYTYSATIANEQAFQVAAETTLPKPGISVGGKNSCSVKNAIVLDTTFCIVIQNMSLIALNIISGSLIR